MISVAYWIAVTALVVMLILLFLAFRRLARLKKDRREIDGGRCLIRDLYKLEPAWAGRTQRGMPPAEVIHEPVDVNALIKEIDAAWAAHQKEKSK